MRKIKEIETRRSIRKYKNKEVENEKILKLIESAVLAPSGSNTQPWNFIIVTSKNIKEQLVKADHNQQWMLDAPVFIVCIADISCRIENSKDLFLDENSSEPELKLIIRDTAICIENLLLEAEHLGLGTCWTGWFEQKDIRKILNIPSDKYVSGIISVGYADEEPAKRPRRQLKDMLHYDLWENKEQISKEGDEVMNKIEERVHKLYWKDDINCARTMIICLSDLFDVKLEQETLNAGIGLHGAGGFRAQCGLVEGALMFIGVYFSKLGKTEEEITTKCYKYAEAFTKKFNSLKCYDLRPNGFTENDPPHMCEKITCEAVAFAYDFIKEK